VKNVKRLSKAKELHVGGDVIDCMANLCMYAEELDIQALSSLLGCNPTEAHRKGDVIKKRPPASIGLWCLESPENLLLPEKISFLIKNTTSDKNAWDKIASTHDIQLRCSLFLHSWTEGFEIPANMIAEVGSRHWKFGMSIYSAEGEEILEAFLKGNKEIKS
jgi:hypothetical protein